MPIYTFGTIKARMGAIHFLMKTLPRVSGEMAVHVLAYNLTRVMNIVGSRLLIAAITPSFHGGSVMYAHAVLVTLALILAPLGAKAADLVVWWSEGYTNQEDEAVREVIAAFEQKTGKQVELVLHPEHELADRVVAAVEAGRPPDCVFSMVGIQDDTQWAYEGRLVDRPRR
jgi:maltose-binding protein MalE